MKRQDYENYKWYPVTDDTYWVEEMPDEFPNCSTIVINPNGFIPYYINTYHSCSLGWGTMAKSECYFFMIIEKPKENV